MNEVDLGSSAFCVLIGAGVLAGIISYWAFRRWSDAAKVRTAINHIVAHLFELRLFAEEPRLVLRAQRDLFLANGKLLRELTGPSLILTIPFTFLLIGMDAIFGRAPLQIGKPAIITMQWNGSSGSAMQEAQLDTPAGIQVETPPLRVPALLQTSWRVRAFRASVGQLRIHFGTHVISKSISSAEGLQWLSDCRSRATTSFLLHPLEPPFVDRAVSSIAIRYPSATFLGVSWLVWFSASSIASGLTAAVIAGRSN